MNGQTYGCNVRIRAALLATLLALFFSAAASTKSASAATYHYCSGCVINAGTYRIAANAKYITNNYAHRLSGPTGTQIGTIAKYADTGAWGNWALSTSTQVVHYYDGTRLAWGATAHWGAGNYGFNAHVSH